MEVSLAVLADCANISREGKLNIMGIFDTVCVPSLPTRISPCYLVLRWVADAAEKGSQKELAFRLLDPDGKLLAEPTAHVNLGRDGPPGPARFDMVLPFPLAFEQYGPHRVCILVNGETKTSIDVTALPPPGASPEHGGGDTPLP